MQIERYELGVVIGTGSFATVYRGRDPRLNAQVAVKVLADNWSADPSIRFRFGQEAALLRRVRVHHRNAPLVEVFDIDEAADGRPYFVMTFADRGTLAARIVNGVRWPGHLVSPVVESLAAGMTALHATGVVHRDLKPSNMLYVSASGAPDNEQLLIGDLGLAKDLFVSGSALTVAGGTPGYMAPEQMTVTSTITAQADIYSASVIIMELLTGLRGVDGLHRLPSQMAHEVERGLSTRPSDRHTSAEEWAEALTAALNEDNPAASGHVSPGLIAPGPVPTIMDESTLKPGHGGERKRPLLVAAVAGISALIAGVAVLPGLFGSPSIGVTGPAVATVGEPIVLTADIPDGGGHRWTFGDERFIGQDLRLTPRSVGTLEVHLDYTDQDGNTASVSHIIKVQP